MYWSFFPNTLDFLLSVLSESSLGESCESGTFIGSEVSCLLSGTQLLPYLYNNNLMNYSFLCNIWYIKFLNIFSIKIKIKFSLVENMMVSQEPVKSVNFYLIFYLWIRRTERIVMNNIIKDWRRLIIILIIIARAYLETKFIL